MLHHQLPGRRGSLPAEVMRSGRIIPISPENARQDLRLDHVLDVTDWRASISIPNATPSANPLPAAPQSPITAAVAQTQIAVPPTPMPTAPLQPVPTTPSDRHHWHRRARGGHPMMSEIQRLHPRAVLHGTAADIELGEWNGRPVAKFQINSNPIDASGAAHALRRAAHALRSTGLASALSPELVGGPLAALMRGGAVELHFQNGAVVRTAL